MGIKRVSLKKVEKKNKTKRPRKKIIQKTTAFLKKEKVYVVQSDEESTKEKHDYYKTKSTTWRPSLCETRLNVLYASIYRYEMCINFLN